MALGSCDLILRLVGDTYQDGSSVAPVEPVEFSQTLS